MIVNPEVTEMEVDEPEVTEIEVVKPKIVKSKAVKVEIKPMIVKPEVTEIKDEIKPEIEVDEPLVDKIEVDEELIEPEDAYFDDNVSDTDFDDFDKFEDLEPEYDAVNGFINFKQDLNLQYQYFMNQLEIMKSSPLDWSLDMTN
jgi:hypothetical protein